MKKRIFSTKVLSHAGLISAGVGLGTYNIWGVLGGIFMFIVFAIYPDKNSKAVTSSPMSAPAIAPVEDDAPRSITGGKMGSGEKMALSIMDTNNMFMQHFLHQGSITGKINSSLKVISRLYAKPQGDAELDYRREVVITDYLPSAMRNYLGMSSEDRVKIKSNFIEQLDAIQRELDSIEQAYAEKAQRETKTLGIFLQDKFPEKRTSALELNP